MKTIAVFLFAGLLAGNVCAQTDTTRQACRRWAISPHFFTGMSHCIATDLPAYTHTDPAAAFGAGADIGYMINPHIWLFTGIQFSRHSYGYHYIEGDSGSLHEQAVSYLEIPLYLRLLSSKPGRLGLVAETGVSVGLLAGTHNTYQDTEAPDFFRSDRSGAGMNKVAVGGRLFLGFTLPVSRGIDILPGLDQQYYFSRLGAAGDTRIYYIGLRLAVNVKMNLEKKHGEKGQRSPES